MAKRDMIVQEVWYRNGFDGRRNERDQTKTARAYFEERTDRGGEHSEGHVRRRKDGKAEDVAAGDVVERAGVSVGSSPFSPVYFRQR